LDGAALDENPTRAAAHAKDSTHAVSQLLPLAALWLLVAVPMAWGLWTTIQQAAVLFR
jgi:hypothetical protein